MARDPGPASLVQTLNSAASPSTPLSRPGPPENQPIRLFISTASFLDYSSGIFIAPLVKIQKFCQNHLQLHLWLPNYMVFTERREKSPNNLFSPSGALMFIMVYYIPSSRQQPVGLIKVVSEFLSGHPKCHFLIPESAKSAHLYMPKSGTLGARTKILRPLL